MNTYKYDLHVHTAETSPCGKINAVDVVRMYTEQDYHGIVITDHYYNGFFEKLPDMSWDDKIHSYLKGYRAACEEGLKTGLKVILGMELRFIENDNDYLVYGLDEKFMLEHPELYKLSLTEFRKLISGKDILIYQAHPFRPGMIAADPGLLDGVEVYNGNPRHNSFNEKAEMFAVKHSLQGISGSDFHQVMDLARGGVLLPCPVDDAAGLVNVLRNRRIDGLLRS